ncbi:Regulator of chromosome condensation, RCC1 [uncultured Caudovirales phage]|uniref:Regulator of chromosome condensation, RCC1 n=1 Tax=uncultured Caudovirales phage TaxID=2100421 RepID=A0A6J5KPY3_9CAUD|nr:Regulator of chromosome condensation, RCC1 [uncultured Caudovirales phage]
MSGFTSGGEELDRIFFTDSQLVDQFVGTSLWSCGYNNFGCVGDGTTINKSSPVTISGGDTTWATISSGGTGEAGIKTDGTLWTWGWNFYGNLGANSQVSRSSPGTTSGGGTTWAAVCAGGSNMFAIKTDGTLWSCGYGGTGILGTGTTTNRSSPGTTAGGGTNWKQVSAPSQSFNTSTLFASGVKLDGTLWTWGNNQYGVLGAGTTVNRSSPQTVAGGGTNWKSVSCGYTHASGLKSDGTIWTWGRNTNGQLGDGTTLDRSSPVTTSGGGTTWKQVSSGAYFCSALKYDGTIWTWGYNLNGSLGNNAITNSSSPGTISGGGTTWKSISVGGRNVCALKTDNTLWIWGFNSVGQLGDGTTLDKSSPVTTSGGGFQNWKSISCGYQTLAMLGQI